MNNVIAAIITIADKEDAIAALNYACNLAAEHGGPRCNFSEFDDHKHIFVMVRALTESEAADPNLTDLYLLECEYKSVPTISGLTAYYMPRRLTKIRASNGKISMILENAFSEPKPGSSCIMAAKIENIYDATSTK